MRGNTSAFIPQPRQRASYGLLYHRLVKRGCAVLHELDSPSRRLHGRHLPGSRYRGPDAGALHIRYRLPRLPWREDAELGERDEPRENDSRELPPAVLHTVTDELLLFTTKTCPNCRIAKAALEKSGKAYTVIDAEENADLCRQYGVIEPQSI